MTIATYPGLVVCAQCDAIHTRVVPRLGEAARCSRCHALIDGGHRLGLQGQFALCVAALVVFVIANAFPIVTLDVRGIASTVTLLQAVTATWQAGERLVALLAAATAFAFPLAVIVLRLALLAPIVAGWRPPWFAPAMRALLWTTRWSMVEVLLLGVLIAVVRGAGIGEVAFGAGLYGFGALTLLLTSIQAGGMRRLWQRALALS
jgi:paraquat-inducible protein A